MSFSYKYSREDGRNKKEILRDVNKMNFQVENEHKFINERTEIVPDKPSNNGQ